MNKNKKQFNKTLTIGIPVRNEEKILPYFLYSLIVAIKELSDSIETEIIICVNGSTDTSLAIVQKFKKHFNNHNIQILRSPQGKMQAQQHIIRSAKFNGPIAFLDADTILDKKCLKELWNTLNKNKELQVAFAKVRPMCGNKFGLEWLQQVYYKRDDDVRTPRRYIHGRAYIIRSSRFFIINDLQNRIARAKQKNMYRTQYLDLEKGPQVDDIYLSRLLVHRFGISSIQEVQKAVVFFVSPRTIKDCYEEQKRFFIEIERNDLLFPEYIYTQNSYFARKLLWNKFKELGLSSTIHYFLYLPFVIWYKKLAKFRLFIGRKTKIGYGKFWLPLSSTKNIGKEKQKNNRCFNPRFLFLYFLY
jgi:glycosyltransferase involved in cell wall biosynthesis